ncbi:uncharacterized protein E0L32_001455 [Thyridium curvatum]|uniref:HECT-type E3 ubiquitin transferase n=1 Tax=Thyridium curvatum TaxID=1093900 RepID=A0A507AZN3_9PEZI|nr:uncharacterized protein E0L32_001455 [Thyridium curvatum]TPX10258.1 hypothetical protein E0L32_001455 [Thyridium curvatum]
MTRDADLVAGLWEVAPFARLPTDAPAELRDLIEEIDNPKRVYAVHRASRRHDFQYIVQLRDGCGDEDCWTATCFTCRKRIVGRAPIRRYNTTSARTLAVYLASQDNPEAGLCPALSLPRSAPAALDSLMFSSKHHGYAQEDKRPRVFEGQNGHAKTNANKSSTGRVRVKSSGSPRGRSQQGASPNRHPPATATVSTNSGSFASIPPDLAITEKNVSKDYRSFAANMFGTVAFKMLEWLTPNAVEEMTERARKLYGEGPEGSQSTSPQTRIRDTDGASGTIPSSSRDSNKTSDPKPNGHPPRAGSDGPALATALRDTSDDGFETDLATPHSSRPDEPRRRSSTRLRGLASATSHRKISVDAFSPDAAPDEMVPPVRSPRLPSISADKSAKGPRLSSTIARPISQLSNAGFFDTVSLEKMPPPKAVDIKPITGLTQSDVCSDSSARSSSAASPVSAPTPDTQSIPSFDPELESTYKCLLPQSLSVLNAEVVDFICDVLQDDDTSERHLLEPQKVTRFHSRPSNQTRALRRRQDFHPPSSSAGLKREWQLFVQQSLFYILADPYSLIHSFTKNGQLYDSQTLWYCMLRLTRVAPSLVFHSLWMAAARLFAPPKAAQSLRSPPAKLFPRQDGVLSNAEAGVVMSICLHALVAAAPLVDDARQLYDMSRIRAHGLSLAGSGAIARQPTELCLQYDDAFSNDLAIRLARRIFAAIPTRRYFDEIIEYGSDYDHDNYEEHDVLSPLFAQLDFLNMDALYVLEFTFSDRTLHETRVPTLLLDWARAVLLHDWDGNPEMPGAGPVGGALALIEAMCMYTAPSSVGQSRLTLCEDKRRQALLLGDSQFRSEYFAERLDEVEMPVAWLSFTSTRQRVHILDFPYIFNPSTLVSYFRSINFSRMSRSFEESSSLQSRMGAIISPGSLIINPHHKSVLQDLLKTASAKYLILDIGRKTVLRDTFDQLWRREEREFLRPLKVHLGEDAGEEGFDSGGVQQEFFRLAIAEALNPDYGAFTVDERTRMTWFRPASTEADWKFELIGMLVSLAVYNGLTLPVTFPKALYRKLLQEPVTELHHIADGWPDLASGLTTLLEWDEKDGAVEDIFARTYEFSVELFDQPISREMNDSDTWPQFPKTAAEAAKAAALYADNPSDAPLVTHENRNAYVTDYIRYLTDVSVRPQYEAFARGFHTCLHPKSLTLLTSSLLQSVVEGVQDIDIAELRRHARYVGWDASHRAVRDFWSIVKRYDDRMKRRLLEFVTASDRVPVGGMKNLQFVVQRNGAEEDEGGHLPTAYTCYGTLLLPEYKSKDILRERLAMALENAQGFGFA